LQSKRAWSSQVCSNASRHFESGLQKSDAFTSPELVANYLSHELAHQTRERFGLLLLDQQHQLISFKILFEGTINQAEVHAREVVKSALEHNAAAIILTHNHPSGDPTPSAADIQLTAALSQALNLIEVRTLDHIIIGDKGRWHSFAQHNQMP